MGSYEGIGQWAATFACSSVSVGQVVKVSSNGTVSACSAEDAFGGMVLAVSRGGDACTVALGGMVTADYSGESAPTVGWCTLSADGTGGVAADEDGRAYLVVDVNTTDKTVTFVM